MSHSDPERAAILDAARAPAEQRLGRPVRLATRTLSVRDGWAFLLADLLEPGGQPIDYAGTPLAEAAHAGGMSNAYAALLTDANERWKVVATAIGPTDVAWEGWDVRYGAPAELFRLDD